MSSIAKSCSTVKELRDFLKGIPGDTLLLYGHDVCWPKFEIHYTEQPGQALQVEVWRGEEVE